MPSSGPGWVRRLVVSPTSAADRGRRLVFLPTSGARLGPVGASCANLRGRPCALGGSLPSRSRRCGE
eukprot:3680831-Pyramimonas_sp.AAC.1